MDTQLQGAVAQHAVDCKQQLADSTAGISDCLSKVSDDNVMHMEEAAVHEVSNLHSDCLSRKAFKELKMHVTYMTMHIAGMRPCLFDACMHAHNSEHANAPCCHAVHLHSQALVCQYHHMQPSCIYM